MVTRQAPEADVAPAVDSIGGTEDPGRVGVGDALVALSKAALHGRNALKAGVGLIPESVRIGLGRS